MVIKKIMKTSMVAVLCAMSTLLVYGDQNTLSGDEASLLAGVRALCLLADLY